MEQTMKKDYTLLIDQAKYSSCFYGWFKAPGPDTAMCFNCGSINCRRRES